jgi:hypothetical protein
MDVLPPEVVQVELVGRQAEKELILELVLAHHPEVEVAPEVYSHWGLLL